MVSLSALGKALEKNGEDSEKNGVSEAVLPSCLERGERFGWLVILKVFKKLFAQMKQKSSI